MDQFTSCRETNILMAEGRRVWKHLTTSPREEACKPPSVIVKRAGVGVGGGRECQARIGEALFQMSVLFGRPCGSWCRNEASPYFVS